MHAISDLEAFQLSAIVGHFATVLMHILQQLVTQSQYFQHVDVVTWAWHTAIFTDNGYRQFLKVELCEKNDLAINLVQKYIQIFTIYAVYGE